MPLKFNTTEIDTFKYNTTEIDSGKYNTTEFYTSEVWAHQLTVGNHNSWYGYTGQYSAGSITPIYLIDSTQTSSAPGTVYTLVTYTPYTDVHFEVLGLGTGTINVTIYAPGGISQNFTTGTSTVSNSALANYIYNGYGQTIGLNIVNNNE